jgi:anti-sigma factor RsiW
MECREVRTLADSFLAEELLTETNLQILAHARTCAACADDIAARRALRESLRQAFDHNVTLAPRDGFADDVRQRLQGVETQGLPAGRRRVPRAWAIAAGVLLAAGGIGGGVVFRATAAAAALARAAVGDHRNCTLRTGLSEQPISLATAAVRYGAWFNRLQAEPGAEIQTPEGPARIVERHACGFDGRQFAHLVVDYRGRRISLLVSAAPAGLSGLPSQPSLEREEVDGASVVSFRSPHHVVFLIGDLPQDALEELAGAVAPALYRELSAA